MVEQIKLLHPSRNLNEQDKFALVTFFTLFFASEEPEEAKKGIIWCIKNRIDGSKKSESICSILFPLGLSTIIISRTYMKSVLTTFGSEVWDSCYLLCKDIFDGKIRDNTNGSDIFFLTSEKLPKWLKVKSSITQYGNVQFYRVDAK